MNVGPAPGSDVALLKTIEARTQQKAVARRAKTMLQAIEDAENARRVAEEERRKQEASLCAAVESLTDITDPDRIAAELARLSAAWDALASTDAAAARRFAAGADAARVRMTQRRSEIDAALEAARRRGEASGEPRGALPARRNDRRRRHPRTTELHRRGVGPAHAARRLRAEAEQLAARFARPRSACRKRLALGAALQEARSALDALVVEAEALHGQEDESRRRPLAGPVARSARAGGHAERCVAAGVRPGGSPGRRLAGVRGA